MKSYFIFGAVVVVLMFGIKFAAENRAFEPQAYDEKIYVALEGENKIGVIDSDTNKIIRNIDLVEYAPHNVQVAPDGYSVWVTANAGTHSHGLRLINQALADSAHDLDQVIVIDPKNDKIVKQIALGKGLHLAHVAVTTDGKYALVTAQTQGRVYKINAKTYAVEDSVDMALASEPHGLRIDPANKTAYIALLKGNGLAVLDIGDMATKTIALSGAAVQSGILPDGSYALASIYDKKQLAMVATKDNKVSQVDLPAAAKGPVQIYPSNDSRFVYVADQGYYFGQPTGDKVYVIDVSLKSVVKAITAGEAPHGVVVSKSGRVYVTNLLSNDVSVIDGDSGQITKIKVGKQPNGISIWNASLGGTP